MKPLLILIGVFCFFSSTASGQSLTEVRKLFHQAAGSEVSCSKLIRMLQSASPNKQPLFYGYKAVATMMMASHLTNPFRKLSHFNEGKKMLEEAIRNEPDNLELRFLRLSVQSETPAFLKYKQDIQSDRSFIREALPNTKDGELKQMISSFLNRKK